VDLYRRVRLARQFGINRETVAKMLKFSEPPGYRRTAVSKRPKLDGFTHLIDGYIKNDKLVPRKQHHTSKRIFERLRDEHGFTGN
jgi:transposase